MDIDFKICLHMGGKFHRRPWLTYVGGIERTYSIDPDELSFPTIRELVEENNMDPIAIISYIQPGMQLEGGIRICSDNASYCRMINYLTSAGMLDVYIEHKIIVRLDDAKEVAEAVGGTLNAHKEGLKVTIEEGNEVNTNDCGAQDLNNDSGDDIDEREDGDEVEIIGIVEDKDNLSDEELKEIVNNYVQFRPGNEDDARPIEVGQSSKAEAVEGTGKKGKTAAKKKNNRGGRLQRRKKKKNKKTDSGEESENIDYLGSSDDGSLEENQHGDRIFRRSNRVFYNPNTTMPHFEVGMIFQDAPQLREALDKYALARRIDFYYKKNNCNQGVRASCKGEGCGWEIHASRCAADGYFKVKTYYQQHDCSITFVNKRANSKNLSKRIVKHLKIMPTLKGAQVQRLAKEDIFVDVPLTIAARARRLAAAEINGKVHDQFNDLFAYVAALRQANPSANVDLMVERASPDSPCNFKRLYVCFSELKTGWKQYCRPIIHLDGCFLKGPFKGELLFAVGRDPNEQIYPIAWAVVEVENKDSWEWFLRNLAQDLELGDGEKFTLMSDMQKGLRKVVPKVLPQIEHRFCVRHFFQNWKVAFRGHDLQVLFWAMAKAANEPYFRKHATDMRRKSLDGLEKLLRIHPKHWSRSSFSTHCKSDVVDNNFSEAFNCAIIIARYMSICKLFDEIKRYVMNRIVKCQKKGEGFRHVLCPRICEKIEILKEKSTKCTVEWNGRDSGFEVHWLGEKFVVNLEEWTCTCRTWDLTGIPCQHAICCILFKGRILEDYCLDYYKSDQYQALYSHVAPVVPGSTFWPETNKGPIMPPIEKAMPGRPKTKWKKSQGEDYGTHLSRHGRKMTCQFCYQQGHNSKGCPQKKNNSNAAGPSNAAPNAPLPFASPFEEEQVEEHQVEAPETEAQVQPPQSEAPPTKAQVEAPETEAQVEAPQTEAQLQAPQTEAPEIEAEVEAPQSEAPQLQTKRGRKKLPIKRGSGGIQNKQSSFPPPSHAPLKRPCCSDPSNLVQPPKPSKPITRSIQSSIPNEAPRPSRTITITRPTQSLLARSNELPRPVLRKSTSAPVVVKKTTLGTQKKSGHGIYINNPGHRGSQLRTIPIAQSGENVLNYADDGAPSVGNSQPEYQGQAYFERLRSELLGTKRKEIDMEIPTQESNSSVNPKKKGKAKK